MAAKSGIPTLIETLSQKTRDTVFIVVSDNLIRSLQNHGIRVGWGVALAGAVEHAQIIVAIAKCNDVLYVEL